MNNGDAQAIAFLLGIGTIPVAAMLFIFLVGIFS